MGEGMGSGWVKDGYEVLMKDAMGKQTIEVPVVPKSPNGSGGLLRMHWAARTEYFHEWRMWIRSGNTFTPAIAADVRCRVHVHQVRRRLLDKDNLYASCKPVLDALRVLNLIKDDSEEWIDFRATQETGPRWKIKTIITIEA